MCRTHCRITLEDPMTWKLPLIALAAVATTACGTCLRSVETPSTEGNCIDGGSGTVCVQEVDGPNTTASTYVRGDDFISPTVDIDLEWCGDATCSPNATRGRALLVVVDHNDGEQTVFEANCENRIVQATVNGVDQIEIVDAPNLSDVNVACGGNEVLDGAFGRWEICEPNLAEEVPAGRVLAGGLARVEDSRGTCAGKRQVVAL